MNQDLWWRGAVIYQIYPRSFMDANGDGIGDLSGIIDNFSYIANLGVDAIWVSPFFKSPMKDFGYDISDYREIDPIFGQLSDFDRLIEVAHASDVKVVIDQVLSHTSDQHAWFEESRQNRTNPKADWYVWADAKPDGTPPNNWLAIFGGSAWQWEPRRQQYYLHNFLTSQPDLNFYNEDVQAGVLDNVEFWLKRGVDGFRLDAINFCFHDDQLRDNPAKPPHERKGRGFSEDNPYAFQYHHYDNTRPQNIALMEKIRVLMDKYPNKVTLGEVSSEDSLKTMAEYTAGGKRLHMAYSFELLTDDFNADYIRQTVEALEHNLNDGWPCWSVGNHDVQRVVTRWGREHASDELAKMITALVCSLRGSICTYQGEELGLTEVEIGYEQMQDPFGIAFWPMFKGRDGCRTPLPWVADRQDGGFSTAQGWLPVANEHLPKAIDVQEQDDSSVLNAFRRLLAWRKQLPALVSGDIQFVDAPDNVLMFVRETDGQKVLACFNLNPTRTEVAVPEGAQLEVLNGHGLQQQAYVDGVIHMSGHSGFFAEIL